MDLSRRVSSDPHRSAGAVKIAKWIREVGLVVEEEYELHPYSVDIYLPELHLAVEVDGPHHSKKKDDKRDETLLMKYCLPTWRISTSKSFPDKLDITEQLQEIANGEVGKTAAQRLRFFEQVV